MHLSKAETEVSISFSRDSQLAKVYTTDPAYVRKLDRLCEAYPKIYQCIDNIVLQNGKLVGKMYEFPKRLISIHKPINSAKWVQELLNDNDIEDTEK